MLRGKFFKLRSETLAIETVGDKRTATTLPADSIVLVTSGPTPDDKRMVEIEWEGRQFVMFFVDLQDRGTEIRKAMGTA